jgi:hypothetical protein
MSTCSPWQNNGEERRNPVSINICQRENSRIRRESGQKKRAQCQTGGAAQSVNFSRGALIKRTGFRVCAEVVWPGVINKHQLDRAMNSMTTIAPLFRVNPRILLPLLIALHLGVLVLIVEALDGEEQPYGSAGQVASLDESQARAYCGPGYATGDFAVQSLVDYRQPDVTDAPRQPCVNFH